MQSKNPTIVPLTIITGFLGSGKTTLINYMLNDNNGRERLAIVKNEIGDIAVDSKIIRGENIIMKELLNGCVCCTLVGELEVSLRELVDTVHPDRIVVETSGAANPAIIAVNIDRIPFLKRDLIVTVIDVVHFPGYKDKSIVARLQHKFTDLVVLNRVGEVEESTIDGILDDVYEQRPGIPTVRTETGRVPLELLFGASQKHISAEALAGTHFDSGHLQQDGIEFFSVELEHPVDLDELERKLEELSDEFYRVKGIVIVRGVNTPSVVNWVCGRMDVEKVHGIQTQNSQLVFIGKLIEKYKESIRAKMESCTTVG